MNWSRSDTKTAYESLLGDASNADIKWFYAEDDELAMGILEALQGGGIDDATKKIPRKCTLSDRLWRTG